MTKKLLNKTTANLLIFSIILLLVAAPIFYLLSNKVYIEETDETLRLHKEEFIKYYLPGFKKKDISLWNKYNRNIKIMSFQSHDTELLFTKSYYDKLEDEIEPYRELNAPIEIEGIRYTFQARINMIESRDMIINIALLFIGIIAILLIGILIINKRSSKRLWRPFYDTLDKIDEFEIDKSQQPQFLPSDIVEFDQLNKNLDRLITKNVTIYKNQREFIENAAHELQTPLALFQGKIDSLFQLEQSKEQSLLLGNLNDDVSRLNRLNKNLLLLSKIDSEHYLEKQPILLNDAIKKNLEFFTEQAKAKDIGILTEFTEIIRIDSNTALVEVMVNNLFLNAIRHNKPDGKIIITLANHSLSFLNTGSDEALNSDKVFQRFAKINPSGHGNGLGLAIIKKITEINQWQIEYTFYNTLHGFTIKFK